MAAETYDSEDDLVTRSPPLKPIYSQLGPSPFTEWLPPLPSRSPSPWEMRPRRKRLFADQKSRTPSPEKSLNPKRRKRNRKGRACQEDAVLVDLMGNSNDPELAAKAGEEALPLSDDSDLEEMAPSQSIRRVDLPMIIHGSTFISRPDSGSEENIIAADVLSALGLKMDAAPEHHKEFRVANGRSVWALGRIMIKCTFAKDYTLDLHCTFYVFKNLTSALIMGMPFLDETQTLVKYQYRFQPRSVPSFRPIQLSSLNNPRKRLYCLVNSQPKFANADTGSEIDVMSLDYVVEREFTMTAVGLHSSTVQLADGSTSELMGKVDVLIVLGTPDGPRVRNTFYVLDGLTCDVLLGEDFLDKTTAFETYRHAFSVVECDDGVAEVNGIVWFNTAESHLSRGMGALALRPRSGRGPVQAENSEQSEESVMHRIKNRVDRLFHRKMENYHSELVATVSGSQGSADLDNLDARELHRQEVAQLYIHDLPAEAREAEISKEDERIRVYERSRTELMARDLKTSKKFPCDYPGCLVKPFDNQDLLDSHAELHQEGRVVAGNGMSERDDTEHIPSQSPQTVQDNRMPDSGQTGTSLSPTADSHQVLPSLRAIQPEPVLDGRTPGANYPRRSRHGSIGSHLPSGSSHRQGDPDSAASSPILQNFTIPDSERSPTETLPHDLNRPPFPLSNGTMNSPPMSSIAPRPVQYPSPQTRINDHYHQPYPHGQPSPAYSVESANMSPPGKPIHSQYYTGGRTPQSEELTPQSPESQLSISSFSAASSPVYIEIDRSRPILPPLSSISEESLIESFKCEHAGCTAPPFQTQYLLDSHKSVHSHDRPHYCPVSGCPRSEGGKGFKRKNEMIRHGLLHESPGYVCPFCPEREHKYPRPDNLQRHVRVNHMDKDPNDPLLREVLAQRCEGGSRGRRRRLGL